MDLVDREIPELLADLAEDVKSPRYKLTPLVYRGNISGNYKGTTTLRIPSNVSHDKTLASSVADILTP